MYPRLIWNSWQSLCLHSWRLRLQTWATMPGPSLSFYSSHNHGVQCVQCEASPLRSPICCPLVQRACQSLWAILKGDKVTCSLIPLTAKMKELDRYALLQEPSHVIALSGFPDKVSCKWAWPQTPSSAPQMCPSVLIPSEMQACLTLDLPFHLWKLIPQTACPGAKKSICSSAPVNHLFCLFSLFCLPFYSILLLGAW